MEINISSRNFQSLNMKSCSKNYHPLKTKVCQVFHGDVNKIDRVFTKKYIPRNVYRVDSWTKEGYIMLLNDFPKKAATFLNFLLI